MALLNSSLRYLAINELMVMVPIYRHHAENILVKGKFFVWTCLICENIVKRRYLSVYLKKGASMHIVFV